MEVKTLPLKRKVTPNLPTMTRLGIREVEAGNRTQSELNRLGTSRVNGETAWIKQVLKKCLKDEGVISGIASRLKISNFLVTR
jgi:hypothetical protein